MPDRVLMEQGATIIPAARKEPDEIGAAMSAWRWTRCGNLSVSFPPCKAQFLRQPTLPGPKVAFASAPRLRGVDGNHRPDFAEITEVCLASSFPRRCKLYFHYSLVPGSCRVASVASSRRLDMPSFA